MTKQYTWTNQDGLTLGGGRNVPDSDRGEVSTKVDLTDEEVASVQALVLVDGNLSSTVGLIASAAANRTAINAALALGGSVQILTPGTIYVDDSLVIYSRTRLRLGTNTKIKLYRADTQPRPLLVNACKLRVEAGAWNACTLTWVSGRNVTINHTAHGRSVGEFALMWSSTLAPSHFAGVFPIVSVTNANSFVIRLHRTPSTSPSGTLQYMLADQGITVEGGQWDMDYATRTGFGSDPLARYGIMMVGVAGLRLKHPVLANCPKYTVYGCGLFDFKIESPTAEGTGSDGVKIYGPAVKGVVNDATLDVNDDGVSVQPKEPPLYISYQMLWGDTHDIKILDTYSTGVANGVVLFPTAGQYMGGIVVDGVSGVVGVAGVSINPGEASAVADDITVLNNRAAGQYNLALRNNGNSGTVRRLIYDASSQVPDDYTLDRASIYQDTACAIDHFEIRGLDAYEPVWPTTSGYCLNLNGVIGTIAFIGGTIDFRNNTGSFAQFLGAVSNITAVGLRSTSNCSTVFRLFAGAGTPTVSLTGCDLSCVNVVSTNVPTTVIVNGNRLNVGAQGVVRSNLAVAIKLRSSGNNWVTTNVLTNGGATGLWEFYGWDIPLNLNTTGVQKTIPGQHLLNTTLAGTLAANRLAHCNGTNFLQLDTPASVF